MVDRPQASASNVLRSGLEPLAYWANNPLTISGVVLTTASGFTMIYSWLVWQRLMATPYAGIVFWLALPALFVAGLLMIPAGMLRRRFLVYRRGLVPVTFPPLDLNFWRWPLLYRRALGFLVGLTGLNIALLTTATYRGVHFVDSVQFCGLTCHRVMQPEFTAYQNSPHSRVACVGCHIGPGASWFARSKLSGTQQVFAVALNTYPRPLPAPVENLRPARETCEQCHWPAKFHDNRVVVKEHYAPDENNTVTRNVLLLRVGGEDPTSGRAIGIHGIHMAPGTVIEYLPTDRRRQTIPLVVLRKNNAEPETFLQADARLTPEQLRAPRRVMDCMDCHNRPTHSFELPEEAVDRMMSAGRIFPGLPFAKKKAVELLQLPHGSHQEAAEKIRAAFQEFYRSSYPRVFDERRKEVESGAEALVSLYLRNVFPEMKVYWGTYPNNVGHMASPGCFRCHGGTHKSEKGNFISTDCTTCHNLLATDDPSPKILQELGVTD